MLAEPWPRIYRLSGWPYEGARLVIVIRLQAEAIVLTIDELAGALDGSVAELAAQATPFDHLEDLSAAVAAANCEVLLAVQELTEASRDAGQPLPVFQEGFDTAELAGEAAALRTRLERMRRMAADMAADADLPRLRMPLGAPDLAQAAAAEINRQAQAIHHAMLEIANGLGHHADDVARLVGQLDEARVVPPARETQPS